MAVRAARSHRMLEMVARPAPEAQNVQNTRAADTHEHSVFVWSTFQLFCFFPSGPFLGALARRQDRKYVLWRMLPKLMRYRCDRALVERRNLLEFHFISKHKKTRAPNLDFTTVHSRISISAIFSDGFHYIVLFVSAVVSLFSLLSFRGDNNKSISLYYGRTDSPVMGPGPSDWPSGASQRSRAP